LGGTSPPTRDDPRTVFYRRSATTGTRSVKGHGTEYPRPRGGRPRRGRAPALSGQDPHVRRVGVLVVDRRDLRQRARTDLAGRGMDRDRPPPRMGDHAPRRGSPSSRRPRVRQPAVPATRALEALDSRREPRRVGSAPAPPRLAAARPARCARAGPRDPGRAACRRGPGSDHRPRTASNRPRPTTPVVKERTMATKSYDDLDASRKDAETLRDSRGVPLDPPQNQGEMFLEDGLAIHLGLEDSEADRARAMKGSLEPAQLERAREHVRSSVEQAQAFTEQHLAQAVAAGGRGYAAGEMNVELDVVRAGQGWLMRHGDRLERKVYGAIWGRDSIDVDASFQRELFGNEALWLNAAYAAVGYEPPHPVDRPWSMVMDVAEAVHYRDVQEQLEAERLGLETAGTGPQETEPGPVDDVLAVVARARLSTRRVIAEISDERPEEASAMLRADRALTNASETLRPDAEEDPGQEQQEWTVTPEQAQATWIETTTRLRTLIDTGQYTAARNEIREMDSYLHNYTSGGTPPGSVEDEYLYGDALNRTTVPLPSVASSMVLRDIRARGELVPDFPDAKHVAATTGVHGLHVSELQRSLTQPGKSPTPRTHESVAFAGAWRAA